MSEIKSRSVIWISILNFYHSLEGVAALRQKQTRDTPENRKSDSNRSKRKGNTVTLNRFFDLVQWRMARVWLGETFLDRLDIDGNPGLLTQCQLESEMLIDWGGGFQPNVMVWVQGWIFLGWQEIFTPVQVTLGNAVLAYESSRMIAPWCCSPLIAILTFSKQWTSVNEYYMLLVDMSSFS